MLYKGDRLNTIVIYLAVLSQPFAMLLYTSATNTLFYSLLSPLHPSISLLSPYSELDGLLHMGQRCYRTGDPGNHAGDLRLRPVYLGTDAQLSACTQEVTVYYV